MRLIEVGLPPIDVGGINLWSGVQGWIRRIKRQLSTIIYLSVSSLQLQGDQCPVTVLPHQASLVLPTLVHCTSCEPDKATFLAVVFVVYLS